MKPEPVPFAAIYRSFAPKDADAVRAAIEAIAAGGRSVTVLRVREWLEIAQQAEADEAERLALQAAICEQAWQTAQSMPSVRDWKAQEWAERLKREQAEHEAAVATGERARRICGLWASRAAEGQRVAA